jgi:hypothetical protein
MEYTSDLLKKNWRMPTCNRLNLETRGSPPVMTKNLPRDWQQCTRLEEEWPSPECPCRTCSLCVYMMVLSFVVSTKAWWRDQQCGRERGHSLSMLLTRSTQCTWLSWQSWKWTNYESQRYHFKFYNGSYVVIVIGSQSEDRFTLCDRIEPPNSCSLLNLEYCLYFQPIPSTISW